jgi:thiamine kinase-like enzyme
VSDVLVLDGLTHDRLTAVLQRKGYLPRGRVERVAIESSRTTLISTIARLRLEYSPDAEGPRPSRLFFKASRPDHSPELAAAVLKEVAFYDAVAPSMRPGIVPHCYDAARDQATSAFHLLLEDLTETHFVVTEWPLPPTTEQCERISEAYAQFHAVWWNEPQLGVQVGSFIDDAALGQWREHYQARFAAFVDRLGDRFSSDRRRVYERAIASWWKLLGRYRSREHLTIIHGDAHVWNLMYPRAPATDSVRLIDWDAWRLDLGAQDLAYMMAVHWYPERRRRLEALLLRRYHEALLTHGVTGYDFGALWLDYRLSVIWQLRVPVWQSSVKLGPWIWWSHLERILQAFDDLGCEELLE